MADGETVYGVSKLLEQCRSRLLNEKEISDNVKEVILDFTDDLAVQGRSKHRQYFYIERPKVVAKVKGDSFLRPTKKDIRDAILNLQKTRTRRKENFSDRTLDDIKLSLKKFYREYKNGEYYGVGAELLKMGTHASKERKPENIVTITELMEMINACVNNRERALISLLFGS